MSETDQPTRPSGRLERLRSFLERDPGNLHLLEDAATAAYEESELDLAAEFIERRRALEPLSPSLANLEGMVALSRGDFETATTAFRILLEHQPGNPSIKFNLAWALAMVNAHADALALLDDETLAISPRAPALKIQLMHHLERYDDAMDYGKELAARFPQDSRLMGTLSTLAMDAERAEEAQAYAERAGDNPEGLATLGMLTLAKQDAASSAAMFERAIELQPTNARAWVGKGLGLLSSGAQEEAARALDRGAELFEDHLGSWIASGWAYAIKGDYGTARARFEHARSLDDGFAESHGGLAVLDIFEGRVEDARRQAEIALRLDRKSLGGALARVLLLEQAGDSVSAARVRDLAFSMPIGPKGRTIGQMLVSLGGGARR